MSNKIRTCDLSYSYLRGGSVLRRQMGREWTRVGETTWARARNLVQLRVPVGQFPLTLRLRNKTTHKPQQVPETEQAHEAPPSRRLHKQQGLLKRENLQPTELLGSHSESPQGSSFCELSSLLRWAFSDAAAFESSKLL